MAAAVLRAALAVHCLALGRVAASTTFGAVGTGAAPTTVRASPCSWRETSDCSATGDREPWNDTACDQTIHEGQSGFCDCDGDGVLSGSEQAFGCGVKAWGTCEVLCQASVATGRRMDGVGLGRRLLVPSTTTATSSTTTSPQGGFSPSYRTCTSASVTAGSSDTERQGWVMTDGTASKPFCTWERTCPNSKGGVADTAAYQACAKFLCNAQGYSMGVLYAVSNDMCQTGLDVEGDANYFAADTLRRFYGSAVRGAKIVARCVQQYGPVRWGLAPAGTSCSDYCGGERNCREDVWPGSSQEVVDIVETGAGTTCSNFGTTTTAQSQAAPLRDVTSGRCDWMRGMPGGPLPTSSSTTTSSSTSTQTTTTTTVAGTTTTTTTTTATTSTSTSATRTTTTKTATITSTATTTTTRLYDDWRFVIAALDYNNTPVVRAGPALGRGADMGFPHGRQLQEAVVCDYELHDQNDATIPNQDITGITSDTVFGNDLANNGPSNAFDADQTTCWKTDSANLVGKYIRVHLPQPAWLTKVMWLVEDVDIISRFDIQYSPDKGTTWVTGWAQNAKVRRLLGSRPIIGQGEDDGDGLPRTESFEPVGRQLQATVFQEFLNQDCTTGYGGRDPLTLTWADGTSAMWGRIDLTLEQCKAICANHSACYGFVRRRADGACFWKGNSDQVALVARDGYDCYMPEGMPNVRETLSNLSGFRCGTLPTMSQQRFCPCQNLTTSQSEVEAMLQGFWWSTYIHPGAVPGTSPNFVAINTSVVTFDKNQSGSVTLQPDMVNRGYWQFVHDGFNMTIANISYDSVSWAAPSGLWMNWTRVVFTLDELVEVMTTVYVVAPPPVCRDSVSWSSVGNAMCANYSADNRCFCFTDQGADTYPPYQVCQQCGYCARKDLYPAVGATTSTRTTTTTSTTTRTQTTTTTSTTAITVVRTVVTVRFNNASSLAMAFREDPKAQAILIDAIAGAVVGVNRTQIFIMDVQVVARRLAALRRAQADKSAGNVNITYEIRMPTVMATLVGLNEKSVAFSMANLSTVLDAVVNSNQDVFGPFTQLQGVLSASSGATNVWWTTWTRTSTSTRTNTVTRTTTSSTTGSTTTTKTITISTTSTTTSSTPITRTTTMTWPAGVTLPAGVTIPPDATMPPTSTRPPGRASANSIGVAVFASCAVVWFCRMGPPS